MTGEATGIDLDRINRFVLGKQHLTADTRTENILSIARDIGGLHSTGATTPYLSLLARMNTFDRKDLEEELYRKKSLARISYVRNTIYLLPKEKLPMAFAAVKRNTQTLSKQHLQHLQLTPQKYKNLTKKIIKLLETKGRTTKEIKAELPSVPDLSYLIRMLCFQGLLIRGKPKSGWRSNLHIYHAFSSYFPDVDLNSCEVEEAQEQVVKNYISAFGPVTEKDIIWWTGFTKGQVKKTLIKRETELTKIEVTGLSSEYYLFTSQLERLKSRGLSRQKPVNLLPCLDPYLMAYRDRDRYLDGEFFNFVYDRSGNATTTILCDGKIAGVWDIDESRLKYLLFSKVTDDVRNQIHVHAEKLGRFIIGKEPAISECKKMLSLTERTAGGFMSPLKYCE